MLRHRRKLMTKEELIKLLKEYKENKAKLNIKLKELKLARIKLKSDDELDTMLTSAYGINQDIHSKNKISNKVLKKIEKNDIKKNELNKEIEILEKIIKDLRDKVETIDDRLEGLKFKERKMLEAYYIEGNTYEDIGNRVYWEIYHQTRTGETIKAIIDEAIEKIAKL